MTNGLLKSFWQRTFCCSLQQFADLTVCIYVCVCVHVYYVCACFFFFLCVCVCVCVCMCMHACVNMCVCVCVCTCMFRSCCNVSKARCGVVFSLKQDNRPPGADSSRGQCPPSS